MSMSKGSHESTQMIEISVVVPVYNESENIEALTSRLVITLSRITESYEIIFSCDPCSDDTIDKIQSLRNKNHRIKYLLMSRRFGQPAATISGIAKSKGKCCILIDADLQDPPELILDLYEKYQEGYDVVHAKRKKRMGENWFRLMVTHMGYWLINYLSETDIPRNVGDFKLISRRVATTVVAFEERNIFIKGLVSYAGFNQTSIEYIRDARYAGTPHYSQLWGSIPQSLNGIYCYSNKPLHLISIFGFVSAILSMIISIIFIIAKLGGINFPIGLVTIILLMSFYFGVLIFSIGILGEYIGRIFNEVKRRPTYIIESEVL